MSNQGRSRGNIANLKPQRAGEPGHNPSGISKAKAKLRSETEKFLCEDGRILKYLQRLDEFAMDTKNKKLALAAINELLTRALGKDWHITLSGAKDDVIKVLFESVNGNGNNSKASN